MLLLSLISKSFFAILLLSSSLFLPLFDSSPLLLSPSFSPLLRWDVFHFHLISIAGYKYEHLWAFFPALPSFLKLAPLFAVSLDSSRILYSLSLHHLQSVHLASITAILSLIPSSPVTLYFAPYNEPFFTYLSYRGMLFCAHNQWLSAAISFALATLFRSNGIFLAGFILWGLNPLFPSFRVSSLIPATLLTALIFSPFIYHNYSAYSAFCSNTNTPALWCSIFPPSIYTYVQSHYWNVGLFRYWSLHQLPNFIIAAPPIILIYAFAYSHFLIHPFLSSTSITPHILYSLFIVSLILSSSHTQIILRLAASMPTTYWAAAWLVLNHKKWAFIWISWSVIWAMISVILWAAFLPPA